MIVEYALKSDDFKRYMMAFACTSKYYYNLLTTVYALRKFAEKNRLAYKTFNAI